MRKTWYNEHMEEKEGKICAWWWMNVWAKDLEDDTYRWKHTPCSLTESINNLNMFTVPKAIWRKEKRERVQDGRGGGHLHFIWHKELS